MKTIEQVLEAFLSRVEVEHRAELLARAKRKSRKEYKMSDEQRKALRRIQSREGVSQLEYLAFDWRTTNPMFSRGWLQWEVRRGVPYVVAGLGRGGALQVSR